jgi:hypothetical protein
MHGGAATKADICIVEIPEVGAEQLWRVIVDLYLPGRIASERVAFLGTVDIS